MGQVSCNQFSSFLDLLNLIQSNTSNSIYDEKYICREHFDIKLGPVLFIGFCANKFNCV